MNENEPIDPGGELRRTPIRPPKKRTIWQKIGGGSLSVSAVFHLILLVIGLFWILQTIPPRPEKMVDFMPPSGGGGAPESETKAMKHRMKMTQPNMSRVVALGSTSNLVLPEPEDVSQMTSMGQLSAGGLSAGLGGKGSGGGRGDGKGTGVGSAFGPGMGNGSGNKNPFGMINPDKDALVGSFYDLKQTKDGKPTGMTDTKMREELMDITRRGFKDSVFDKYFKAPRKLYQTKLYIPTMPADAAPAAFEVQNEVQSRMWAVVYRGAVKAPKTGTFRFVGESDDFLVVRFNNRPVFDFGYTMAGTGIHVNGRAGDFNGTNDNPQLAKEVRRLTPMTLPIQFYKYVNSQKHNQSIGGLAVGPAFQVEAGRTYPIEIMTGEIPGGSFSVELLIEEIGFNYQKDAAGAPILPLFRMDNSLPEIKGDGVPFDPAGPIWPFDSASQNWEI